MAEPVTPKFKTSVADSAIGTISHRKQTPQHGAEAANPFDGPKEVASPELANLRRNALTTSSDGEVFGDTSTGSNDMSQLFGQWLINRTALDQDQATLRYNSPHLPANAVHREPPKTPTQHAPTQHAPVPKQTSVSIVSTAAQATESQASSSNAEKPDDITTVQIVHRYTEAQLVKYIESGTELFQHDLFRYLPLNVNVRRVTEPKKCIATLKSKPRRCKNEIPREPAKAKSITSSLEKEVPTELLDLPRILCRMNETLCGTHRKSTRKALKLLLPKIKERVKNANTGGDPTLQEQASVDLLALRFWSRELLEPDKPLTLEISWNAIGGDDVGSSLVGKLLKRGFQRAQRVSTDDLYRQAEKLLAHGQGLGFFKFMRLPKKNSEAVSVRDGIEKVLQEEKTCAREGLIYAFTLPSPAYAGKCKIGYSRHPAERIEKWGGHWNLEPETIFEDNDKTPIPHVSRLETLIYAELRDFRKQIPCCGNCEGSHIEWVATSPAHVNAVIKKWTKWMRDDPPFEEKDGIWKLKEAVPEKKIEEMCEPLPIHEKEECVIVQETAAEETILNEQKEEKEAIKMRQINDASLKAQIVKREATVIPEEELPEPTPEQNEGRQLPAAT